MDFNHDIRPILAESLFACHGVPDEAKRKARLRLDLHDVAVHPAKSGAVAIVPGSADRSELIKRTASQDEDERMPPIKTGKRLTTDQLGLLRRWIDQGAEYKTHRFFLPPQASELPAVNDKKWPRNPIDYYILARLEQEGLKPAPEANRRALIRRLKLDLLGLPRPPRRWRSFWRIARRTPTSGWWIVFWLPHTMASAWLWIGSMRRVSPTPMDTTSTQAGNDPLARLGHRRLQPQPAI